MDVLEALGTSKEELREMIVAGTVTKLFDEMVADGDYGERISDAAQKMIREAIDEQVKKVIVDTIKPMVSTNLESMLIRHTNSYGETKRPPETLTEYVTRMAVNYMADEVDYQGRPKGSRDYSGGAATTRISYMVHEHLRYTIDAAMKNVLQDANNQIVGGLKKAIEMQLDQIRSKLSVIVKL